MNDTMSRQLALLVSMAFLQTALFNCEERDRSNDVHVGAIREVPSSSPWRKHGEGSVVAAADQQSDRELDAAIAQARATAAQAQKRWLQTNAADRQRWFIKWAATTVDESVEHVWVQPVNWSPFRVEGVLVSAPVHPLHGSKSEGDLVSFPIEELSDWVHFTNPATETIDYAAPHEGGFTVKVLQVRFGKPDRS